MGLDIDKIKFEQEHIDRKFKSSKDLTTIYKAMMCAEYQKNFEIGMVVVCRQVNTGKLVTNSAGVPQKYIVAEKLAGVLCLCRRVGINGRPGKGIEIIANYDPRHYVFEEDPDVADAILLGIDYDPLEFPKKMGRARQRSKKYNSGKKLSKHIEEKINTTSRDQVTPFIEDMIILSPTQTWDVWRLKDESTKEFVKIYEVNSKDHKVWAMVGGKKELIETYAFASTWGDQYYIEEPRTVKEELDK